MSGLKKSNSGLIRKISAFISRSSRAELPPNVVEKAKHHILDTLAAMISGSRLKAGQVAILFAENQKGGEEAQVVGSRIVTSAINAAFANGMMAHADETDDSHELSGNHPGCAVVPAALATAEREAADGFRFLKGVVIGYDLAVRMNLTLGGEAGLKKRGRSTHSWGGNFGAAAATASILRLNTEKVQYAMSYTAHRASGALHYVQDKEHIEKAFVFGGAPAQNGVSTGILMQLGFSGVLDPFSGDRNFLGAFRPDAKPLELTRNLGQDYAIMSTNIKKFAVGSPIQAPLDAVLLLMTKHLFGAQDVQEILVSLPAAGPAATVNNRELPNVNLQYLLAACIIDGQLTPEATHSLERMKDPEILELKKKIKIKVVPELLEQAKTERQAAVEVFTKNGMKLREYVRNVRGSKENQMTTGEVERKCTDLMMPVIGKKKTDELFHTIWELEKVKDMRQLRSLLSVS